MNICFYNSTRRPIITLHDLTLESEEYVSFRIETYGSVYEATVDGRTGINTFNPTLLK